MKYSRFNNIVAICLSLCLLICCSTHVEAKSKLPSNQRRIADVIAKIAIDNYDKYGVLPSVAVAQAFVESTLGEHKSNTHNYFGIKSGAVGYSSLEEGVIAYLKIINNGYYKGAPFCKNYKTQMSRILSGGYCEPVGDYYYNAIWSIQNYEFYRYDDEMFEKQKKAVEEKKRKEKRQKKIELKNKLLNQKKKEWSKIYTLKYDPSIDGNFVTVDSSKISSGCIQATNDDDVIMIRDVKPGQKGYIIGVSEKEWNNKQVVIQVFENAKG